MDNNRQQILNDTRAMLDWLEAHPSVELPYEFTSGMLLVSVNTKDEVLALAREFGECEKQFLDDHFRLRKHFGSTSLYAFTQRTEVCERIVVGSEDVPERVTPAHTRDVVEWKCSPLLNGDAQ